MKSKINLSTIIFYILLMVVGPLTSNAQINSFEKESLKGRYVLNFGLGYDYANLGFKPAYYFTDNFSAYMAIGFETRNTPPSIGIQYEGLFTFDAIEPYILLQIDKNYNMTIRQITTFLIEEKKSFLNVMGGVGIKIHFSGFDLMVGLNRKFVFKERIEDFKNDFREAHGDFIVNGETRALFPSIGITMKIYDNY